MSKELQELRNQGRGEDTTSATESSAETGSSSMNDEGVDDFQLSSFTVDLKGVLVNSSVATEAFIVYVYIFLQRQSGVAYQIQLRRVYASPTPSRRSSLRPSSL